MKPISSALRDLSQLPRPKNLLPDPPAPAVCATCRGADWVKPADVIDPEDPRFGEIVPCPDCTAPRLEAQAMARILGPSGLENHRDEDFAHNKYRPGQEVGLALARRWLAGEDTPTSLLFWGSEGSGKTRIAFCIGNALLDQGEPVVFRNVPILLEQLRQFKEDEAGERLKLVLDCPYLILDDLGKENPTHWARERIYLIANWRLQERKATIITTNREPDADEFPRDLASRFNEPDRVAVAYVGQRERER